MSTVRQNKVASLVQKNLADIFQKEMKNAFGPGMITVTHVFMSPDLSFAKTYLSIFPINEKEKILGAVRKQTKEIRKLLGMRIKTQLRIVPEIAFFADESAEYAEKMEKIFKRI
jgi:ribosome-binding factor A